MQEVVKNKEIELRGLFNEKWKCIITDKNTAVSKCGNVAFTFEYIDGKLETVSMLDLTRIKECNFE